jgi:bla regulator protein blaR1
MLLQEFAIWLVDASLAGSIIALAILIARLAFRQRLDGNLYYSLWMLFALRLVLPPILPDPAGFIGGIVFSIQRIFNPANRGANPSAISEGREFHMFRMGDPGDYALTVIRRNHQALVFGIWLAGTISILCYIVLRNLRTLRALKGTRLILDERMLRIHEECRNEAGIRRDVKLMHTGAIKAPALFGIVSPVILLPEGAERRLGDKQLRYVILHELMHLKGRDALVNAVSCIIQAIHWFNPLVAYAFYRMRQDRETACDSRVVSRLGAGERREYGMTILHFAQCDPEAQAGIGIAPFGKGAILKRRLIYLSFPRKELRGHRIAGGLLAVAMGCLFLTSAGISPGDDRYVGGLDGDSRTLDLSTYFKDRAGCFVLYDQARNKYSIFSERDCRQRVSPDSTFKILSALAALESGFPRDSRTVLSWDGTVYPFTEWNRDQTLDSAMALSVNWFFERIDRRLGPGRLGYALKSGRYGNQDMSGGIDDFWNESSLKISPLEQVEFLRSLNGNRLPYSYRTVESVKRAIEIFRDDARILYGKTGSGIINYHYVRGWFVGYITSPAGAYYFATYIWGEGDASGETAKRIALRILGDMKLWGERSDTVVPLR